MNAEWNHKNAIATWLGSKFRSEIVANIRLNLRPFHDDKSGLVGNFTEADARKIASRFRNEVNQCFYGNKARRFGKDEGLRVVTTFHAEPHRHLHILCELPASSDTRLEREHFAELANFLKRFCGKHRMISGDFYLEEATNTVASLKYNARNGTDTVIDF